MQSFVVIAVVLACAAATPSPSVISVELCQLLNGRSKDNPQSDSIESITGFIQTLANNPNLEIDDFCNVDNLQGDVGAIAEQLLHTGLNMPDRAFDSNGNVFSAILTIVDDNLGGGELIRPEFADDDGFGEKLQLLFTASKISAERSVFRALDDDEWLAQLNAIAARK